MSRNKKLLTQLPQRREVEVYSPYAEEEIINVEPEPLYYEPEPGFTLKISPSLILLGILGTLFVTAYAGPELGLWTASLGLVGVCWLLAIVLEPHFGRGVATLSGILALVLFFAADLYERLYNSAIIYGAAAQKISIALLAFAAFIGLSQLFGKRR